MQPKEMDRAWAEKGGRPTQPWTPAMARQMIPEFFNESLNARAAGTSETATPATDGETSSDGEAPSTENATATPSGETPSTESASGGGAPQQNDEQQRQAQAREQLPAKRSAYEAKEQKYYQQRSGLMVRQEMQDRLIN